MQAYVRFDTPPDMPKLEGTDGMPCDGAPWVRTAQPDLEASVSDPDVEQDGRLHATFALWPEDDPAKRTTFPEVAEINGYVAHLKVPSGVVADGGAYAWQVRVADGEGLMSGWSGPCRFRVDTTPPAKAPVVSSTDYPAGGGDGGGEGIPGTFTFSAEGADDVIGFVYGVADVIPNHYVVADKPGGTASVVLTPPDIRNILSVAGVDRAGNRSPMTDYRFPANNTEPAMIQDGHAVAGKPTPFHFRPGTLPAGYNVVSYSYSVNGKETVKVAARPDGTAAAQVALDYGSNRIKLTSTSANGWVSPAWTNSVDADNSPTVTSALYPEYGVGGGVGQTGSFELLANLPGSTTFAYSFDGATWQTVASGDDATATISWTPQSAGPKTLTVYSQSADGTQSDWYHYIFTVDG